MLEQAKSRGLLPRIDERCWNNALPFGRARALLYGATLISYIFLWPYSRSYGAAALGVVIIAAVACVVGSRRVVVCWPAVVLALWSLIYAFLSMHQFFPVAWTAIHLNSVIPQQALGYVVLPLLIAANAEVAKLFLLAGKTVKQYIAIGIAVASTALVPVLMSTGRSTDIDIESGIYQLTMLNTFFSSELLMMAVVGAIGFALRPFPMLLFSSVAILLTTNVQPRLAIMLMIFARLFKPNPRLTVAFVFVVLAVTMASTLLVTKLVGIDINTGIRAQFWRDGIAALIDTKGLGVGFGTEGVKSYYAYNGVVWKIDPNVDSYLLTGLHNSVVNASFRLGIVGGIASILFILAIVPRRSATPFLHWIVWLLVIDLTVNVAIESVAFVLGLSSLAALVLVSNRFGVYEESAVPVEGIQREEIADR